MQRNFFPRTIRLGAVLALGVVFAVELAAEVGERRRDEIDVEAELAELENAPAPAELPPPASIPEEAAPPPSPTRAARKPGVVRELRPQGEAARMKVFEESGSLFSRGVDAHRRGELELAAARYRQALEIDPSFVEAMVNLARVLGAQGAREAAEDWLDRARGVQPGYPGVPAARGWLAFRSGETARAVEHLEEAHRLAPEDVDVLVNLGAALTSHGRLHQARKALETAVRYEPEDDQVVLNLAVLEDRAGDAAAAVHRYRRYLELAPQNDPMRAEVQRRLGELGAPQGAPNVGVSSGPVPGHVTEHPKEEENER